MLFVKSQKSIILFCISLLWKWSSVCSESNVCCWRCRQIIKKNLEVKECSNHIFLKIFIKNIFHIEIHFSIIFQKTKTLVDIFFQLEIFVVENLKFENRKSNFFENNNFENRKSENWQSDILLQLQNYVASLILHILITYAHVLIFTESIDSFARV